MTPSDVRKVLESNPGDRLEHMFEIQKAFADLCYTMNDLRDKEGKILTVDRIAEDAENLRLKYSDLMVPWVWDMHRAMTDELREVAEILPWKHWSKSEVGEKEHPECTSEERLNHLRLELIDIIHFLMEALMFTGLSSKDVYDLYVQKNMVNIERQEKAYNDANKTEEDNDGIAAKFDAGGEQ